MKNLIKIKRIAGSITVETGLHIGGKEAGLEIGGMDNPVVKDPVTKLPYIPGSSLKGKMRSLLEWKLGKIENDGRVSKDETICRIFGKSADNKSEIGPTRLIVRDSFMSPICQQRLQKENIPMTEDKAENFINRITAKAEPRNLERVVPGTVFTLEILYRVFDMGDGGKTDEDYFKYVEQALKAIENDALGGGGSRGSGKVKFKYEIIEEK